MPFKRLFCTCAATLTLLSVGSTGVMASTNSHTNHSNRIVRHLSNVKRSAHIRAIHTRNVRRINRIKRHLINHQRNLIKISKRINRMRKHHRNANLIKRLNNDKARLIKAVENNERGMVRLAQTVANEEHQINLIRHPRRQNQNSGPTVQRSNEHPSSAVQVNLPQPASNDSVGRSVMTVINEVNGKLTKYVAKDSGFSNHNDHYTNHSYSDVNGHYSASPEQITQNEMSQLNQQIQNQIQNSNSWFKQVNHDMNQEFNFLF